MLSIQDLLLAPIDEISYFSSEQRKEVAKYYAEHPSLEVEFSPLDLMRSFERLSLVHQLSIVESIVSDSEEEFMLLDTESFDLWHSLAYENMERRLDSVN